MKTAEFNENFELDRRTRGGVRANPKHAPAPPEIMTADGAVYDSNQKYYFFDAQVQEIKQSLGLRRDGEYFCTFGLRVIAVSKLRINRDDALANGQMFFKSKIEEMQNRIQSYELEKMIKGAVCKETLITQQILKSRNRRAARNWQCLDY